MRSQPMLVSIRLCVSPTFDRSCKVGVRAISAAPTGLVAV